MSIPASREPWQTRLSDKASLPVCSLLPAGSQLAMVLNNLLMLFFIARHLRGVARPVPLGPSNPTPTTNCGVVKNHWLEIVVAAGGGVSRSPPSGAAPWQMPSPPTGGWPPAECPASLPWTQGTRRGSAAVRVGGWKAAGGGQEAGPRQPVVTPASFRPTLSSHQAVVTAAIRPVEEGGGAPLRCGRKPGYATSVRVSEVAAAGRGGRAGGGGAYRPCRAPSLSRRGQLQQSEGVPRGVAQVDEFGRGGWEDGMQEGLGAGARE